MYESLSHARVSIGTKIGHVKSFYKRYSYLTNGAFFIRHNRSLFKRNVLDTIRVGGIQHVLQFKLFELPDHRNPLVSRTIVSWISLPE